MTVAKIVKQTKEAETASTTGEKAIAEPERRQNVTKAAPKEAKIVKACLVTLAAKLPSPQPLLSAIRSIASPIPKYTPVAAPTKGLIAVVIAVVKNPAIAVVS